MSIGCNNLIKNNKAALVQSVEDLFFLMDWDEKNIKPEKKTILRLNDLTDEEKTILAKIGTKSYSIDQISFHTGIKIPLLSATLLSLEFKGLVSVKPGGIYTRVT